MSVRSITPNDPANFTPTLGDYKELKPFRFWCQKVLPLVYDDSLSYYELLCKVVDFLNKTMEDVETLEGDVTNLHTAYKQLQDYVNNYFSTLDVQEEINNKLDEMAKDGSLTNLIKAYIDPLINEQNQKITVLENRMNTFTSLPDGSTTGDAELTDIRVPASGYNYNENYKTAGEAVRGQVSTNKKYLDLFTDNFSNELILSYANTTVNIVNGSDVEAGVKLIYGHLYAVVSNYMGALYLYNTTTIEKRYYLENGYGEFTPDNSITMISGAGTFTANILFIDVTYNNNYKELLKKYGYSYVNHYNLTKPFVNYINLSEMLRDNFIPMHNLWTDANKTIGLINNATINFDANNFNGTFNNDGYIVVFEELQENHKYAIYYEITCTNNYTFSLRLYDGGWKQNLLTVTQTQNVSASDTIFIDVTNTGKIGFDFSAIGSTNFIGLLKIYDITDKNSVVESYNYNKMKNDEIKLNAIETQNTADNNLLNKKMVFYGDSITAQNKYVKLIKDYYGVNAINMGVGGSSITYENDSSFSSDTRIETIPEDADIIFIMGGTNDWNKTKIEGELTYNNGFDKKHFKGALAYTIQKIEERCKNAKIIVSTLIGGRNETRATSNTVTQYLPEKDRYGQSDYDFRNAEIDVANLLNIDVCDTWLCGINGINADICIADTVHPTDAGAKLIANYIIGYLKNVIL